MLPIHLARVVLGNPEHRLPMPGTKRLFGVIEVVDVREAFWLACLADGSIRLAPEPAEAAPAPEPAAD